MDIDAQSIMMSSIFLSRSQENISLAILPFLLIQEEHMFTNGILESFKHPIRYRIFKSFTMLTIIPIS